eukprot:TRINITY_DN62924_c0_g1_i1.p1 TRINITY_DN62924_c0_g1~~TRINITY_DN62924_c0_g1_i1.p1  ORF type:complete len:245 (-),score=73.73 TRINITY_DN62924_c0_g1_i1:79-813(-)
MAKRLLELGLLALDPSTAMMELDRGLRSSRIQDQCESVFWLGRVMEAHPTPVVVNTVVLKLVVLFRSTSNNFIRHCIFRTIRQYDHLLGCVLNKETVLQRILVTLDENLAESRAIALRLIGAMAVLSSQSLAAHHRVCGVLSAVHPCESEAALWAAEQLAPKSTTFSQAALSVISERVGAIETAPDTLLRMFRVLTVMTHTPETACLLYTSDAADEEDSVDLGGRRIIKKKKKMKKSSRESKNI